MIEPLLPHYSRALNALYAAREAAAYEALVIDYLLGFKTTPQTVVAHLSRMQHRMVTLAHGRDLPVLPAERRLQARKFVGAPGTLTRAQWEACDPEQPR